MGIVTEFLALTSLVDLLFRKYPLYFGLFCMAWSLFLLFADSKFVTNNYYRNISVRKRDGRFTKSGGYRTENEKEYYSEDETVRLGFAEKILYRLLGVLALILGIGLLIAYSNIEPNSKLTKDEVDLYSELKKNQLEFIKYHQKI